MGNKHYTAEQKVQLQAKIATLMEEGAVMKDACRMVGIHPSVYSYWRRNAKVDVDVSGLGALQEKLTEMPARSCVQDIGNKMVRVFVFEGPCPDVVDTLNRVFWA
jgi:transposase-like protein